MQDARCKMQDAKCKMQNLKSAEVAILRAPLGRPCSLDFVVEEIAHPSHTPVSVSTSVL